MDDQGAHRAEGAVPAGDGAKPPGPTTRAALAREAAVFQLKLIADGLRDAVLIPVSLVAALIGLVRGGDDADREFRRVLDLGRDSERWINLFGHHETPSGAGSMDDVLDRIEDALREQARKGTTTDEARAAVNQALEKLRRPEDREG